MNKKLLAAGITGLMLLAGSAPLMAQNAFWSNPSPTCMQAAIRARDEGLVSNYNSYNQSMTIALQTRESAEVDAWGIADTNQRSQALYTAEQTFTNSFNAASTQLTQTKASTNAQYQHSVQSCNQTGMSSSYSYSSSNFCNYNYPPVAFGCTLNCSNKDWRGCPQCTVSCGRFSSSSSVSYACPLIYPYAPPGCRVDGSNKDMYGCPIYKVMCASSSSTATCSPSDCGPAMGMPNWTCPGGSLGGPVCTKQWNGRCGYIIHQCQQSSSSSSSSTWHACSLLYPHAPPGCTVKGDTKDVNGCVVWKVVC